MSEITLEMFPHQDDFIFSDATHTALIAGYGAGKSHAGVAKTVLKKLDYVDIPVAYYLPTFGLIRDIAFPKFTQMLTDLGIPFRLNKTDKDIHTPYGIIHLRSMDKPESIVGYEVGYSLIDETDILPTNKMQDVFSKIIGRNRRSLPGGETNKTDVVGTPEGFKWAYSFFVKDQRNNRRIIKGKTSDNTTLPETFIDTLREVYTEEQLLAYLEGEFVNLNFGTVYKMFNRTTHHTDRVVEEGDVLHIGMDFNISNMHAVVNVVDGSVSSAVHEFVKKFDTREMCRSIAETFEGHKVYVYPDASGSSRKTSASRTDFDIIKDFGFTVRSNNKNPFVRDRVNSMNSAFMKGSQLVNTEKCPVLTEALEQQVFKNGEPDKTSGHDHINEAQGYYTSYGSKVHKGIKSSFSY